MGFGKGTASKQLWIDGIDPTVTEAQMERSLGKYGRVSSKRARWMLSGEGARREGFELMVFGCVDHKTGD